jgi:hypothetical protein
MGSRHETRLRSALVAIGAATLVPLAGCNRPTEPDASADRATPGSAAPERVDTRTPAAPADVEWTAPAGWPVPPTKGAMRKASYIVPRAEGDPEDGDLSVAQAGGSVDQNITRWAGQFGRKASDMKRRHKTVAGLDVTLVELRGDYAGMATPGVPASGKKSGWALLGAIVPTNPPTFFKLTGPEKTVARAQAGFDALIDSLKPK